MMFFPATSATQLRLYLDESGTLGFGDEVFTMAMVLVSDLAKLEGCIARNKTTQAEIKASQMKTTSRSTCSPSTRQRQTPVNASSTKSCSTTR